MKLLFLFFISFLFVNNVHAQSKKKVPADTIIWRAAYKLRIEDFEGRKKGKQAGESVTGIFFHTREGGGTIKLVVEAVFEKSKSFLRDSSQYVLQHEQGHFDVTEANARKMRRRIAEKDFTKVKNISDIIKNIYEKTNAEWNREQELYDNGTEHGMNPAKQDIWNAKIAAELKELEPYASGEIDIRK